jgi:hypothetical protein
LPTIALKLVEPLRGLVQRAVRPLEERLSKDCKELRFVRCAVCIEHAGPAGLRLAVAAGEPVLEHAGVHGVALHAAAERTLASSAALSS